ncbi:AraC family transcriptional regulator [Pseudorhodoferax sp.]|uniref:AraC family transcriptional regulator n=1 Tax=Pseudorhodoferax sp. TaxID=1993553 RepID=UPI002DD68406|nr:AraC family transcriptional regulator [Pseudorhodoferax sp.]
MSGTHHTVAIAQAQRMLQGARHQGYDVDRILHRAGISRALLDSDTARISQTQCTALVRVLVRVMRDEFWGLCDTPVRFGSFGAACDAMVQCTHLGEAIRAGLRHYHLMLDDFTGRLQVQDGVAEVALFERVPWHARHAYAQSTFLFCGSGLLSWLVARKLPLIDVRMRNTKTAFNNKTHRLFDAPILFGQPRAGIRFDARWLELPVVQNAQSLQAFLRSAPANLLVKYRDQTSATERIRQLLRKHMGERILTLEEASSMLAMTPQTLRRRLLLEGQGFQAIKDDLRRDMAIEYLSRPDLTVLDISALVGFSEPSTFQRAFKGWTGVAPGEYRQTRLEQLPPG